jgi:hypothetical protein
MSGALNSVLGPVGGFIANTALNVASVAFPPLAIANGLGNLMAGAVGGAINGAMDALTKECGMPKFIGGIVKDIVSNLLPQQMTTCPPMCGDFLADKVGGKFADFAKQLMGDIVDTVKKYMGENEKNCRGGGGPGGAAGAGKSWFVALMTALGEVQNKQAEKVQKLAGEVSESLGQSVDGQKDPQGAADLQKAQFDKMEEFKAEAKLQEIFANVTKAVGDAIGNSLATVARPQ